MKFSVEIIDLVNRITTPLGQLKQGTREIYDRTIRQFNAAKTGLDALVLNLDVKYRAYDPNLYEFGDPAAGATMTAALAFADPLKCQIPEGIRTVTTTHTLAGERYLLADATAGAFTVTLPVTTDLAPGRLYTIKKIDNVNDVTIQDAATELIDGAGSVTLTAQWQRLTVLWTGTTWAVVD